LRIFPRFTMNDNFGNGGIEQMQDSQIAVHIILKDIVIPCTCMVSYNRRILHNFKCIIYMMKLLKNSVISILWIWIILGFQYSIATVTTVAAFKADTLSFLHITDTHIIFNLADYHPKIEQNSRHYLEGIKPFENFCKSVQKTIHPDFMVITGDLTDFFEAETPQGDMLDIQVNQFLRLLDSGFFPVYLTLGNHDISSYYVENDSFATNQYNAGCARAIWIRNAPCFKDGTYYSRVFEVDETTYRLIFLDNSYKNKNGKLPFIIDKPQIFWLDDQMQKSTTDVEIIFMHMPLPDIDGISTENLNSDSAESEFEEILNLLKKNPSARLIITGHRHNNIIKDFRLSNDHKFTQVQTAAFGDDPKNWRLIKLTGKKILISNPGNSEIQLVIPIR
jgi:predicted MPP superfamily phosphohydrolase